VNQGEFVFRPREQPESDAQEQFLPVEGLSRGGCFRAKTDKKGKKGQKDFSVLFAPSCPSCPFLPFKGLAISPVGLRTQEP
jgi:hypothetical protein